MNQVILKGFFSREPLIKETKKGDDYAIFTLCVDREYKGQDWIDCIMWNIDSSEWRNFHKGSTVQVAGELQIRLFEDKDGNKRRSSQVVVKEIDLVIED